MTDLTECRHIFAELAEAEAKLGEEKWFAKGEGTCCGVYEGEYGKQGRLIDFTDPTWAAACWLALARNVEPGRRGMELLERVETLQATVMKDSLAWHELHKEVDRLRAHLRAVLPLIRGIASRPASELATVAAAEEAAK